MAYQQPPYKFERLDKDKAILLIVDHQLGLLQLVKDYTTAEFRNNVLAHAELGKLFDLPTILTTSAETGPNGPLPKEITDMYPNAPFIRRNGEVNAWDNPDFRKAVEATGRKQVILGGIVTEVCTMFLALSLREAGYSVWANTEASGTATPKLAEDANRRMENAGVHLVSQPKAIAKMSAYASRSVRTCFSQSPFKADCPRRPPRLACSASPCS
ncbi:hypothetical protein CLAIMM_05681 isoform 1 [Cladophialophora immunda]|nr:hypothetical protein CLAIMM_05681 isoform 1 [Cladophialophora immunda]